MQAGETRMVFGAAGSGKTTLLKVALGLLKPDSGHVYLFGQDVTELKEQDLFDIRARSEFCSRKADCSIPSRLRKTSPIRC